MSENNANIFTNFIFLEIVEVYLSYVILFLKIDYDKTTLY